MLAGGKEGAVQPSDESMRKIRPRLMSAVDSIARSGAIRTGLLLHPAPDRERSTPSLRALPRSADAGGRRPRRVFILDTS